MLVEIIFRGSFSDTNWDFIRGFLSKSKRVYFNIPEIDLSISFDVVIDSMKSNYYFDLVINTDFLEIKEKVIPQVFINITRNHNEVNILLFFDVNSLDEASSQTNLDYLRDWAIQFEKEFRFEYFICQIDNAGDGEYFFDSKGIGKLYLLV